ncbi:hypothetical protein GLOTRDRAFT_135134 [Gloeophyllum trabeum ATCC 11539]|uniref:PEHE domain-containing protein n=1 Tax=Gloeophyllum trabeum (strain ATCC 11539 / FP-39264 / Madison 617) TaxID=670483 RepID=S7RZL6_GLOTA|nr:uncharacterized protein GLOTRDRAFT_135134 [Gloeophyllum trabeum ATCC 11539]EPQ60460.1 hypothetical protein GLOTRDRAFT_135134 [Gloeophyllum trabeum ATCC 11539]
MVNTPETSAPNDIKPGKRKGKQRAYAESPTTSVFDTPSKVPPSSKDSDPPSTRQKRVLPSRSRRGGPGIGNCDVDMMILDAYRRKFENEPLIPANTRFLLTTNSALIPSTSSSSFEMQLNSQAYERYFDRPEVIKAYRAQQTIQTPEYSLLSEDASVGSRFRPRGSEDQCTDTSDAAYEKRHRKYETFEKRQRLREKEKLKHEQYKLKERIDQLRVMDASAFLCLPDSALPPPEDRYIPHFVDDELNGINTTAAHAEGERRRKEMLDVAKVLEERYNVLLPPDRKWLEKVKNGSRQKSISFSIEPEPQPRPMPEEEEEEEDDYDEEEEEEEEEEGVGGFAQQEEVTKEEVEQKVEEAQQSQHEDGESEIDVEERKATARGSPEKIKLKIRLRPSEVASATRLSKLKSSSSLPGTPSRNGADYPASGSSVSVVQPRIRSTNGRFSPRKKAKLLSEVDRPLGRTGRRISARGSERAWSHSDVTNDAQDMSVSAGRSISSRLERNTCILLATAQRNAGEPNVRKTQRHLTAFGLKVPYEVEEFRDFELPLWLRPGYESEKEDAEDDRQVANGHRVVQPIETDMTDVTADDSQARRESASSPDLKEVDIPLEGG